MNNKLTRTLTMGAVATATFVALYAMFAINEEMLQELLSLISIIPIALYTRKFGMRAGCIAAVASIALSFSLVQYTVLFIYAIPSAITGVVFGMCICRMKLVPAVMILWGIYICRLIYELSMSSWLLSMDVGKEYSELISLFTEKITNGNVDSTLGYLAHDMALCSIPIIFLLGAFAKAGIAYIITGVIVQRIFKDECDMVVPKISASNKLLAVLYLAMCTIFIIVVVLLFCNIIAYNFAIGLGFDIVILLMYVFLMYCLRNMHEVFNVPRPTNPFLTLVMIFLFPITDLVFSIKFLTLEKKDEAC